MLVDGPADRVDLVLAARIAARYSAGRDAREVELRADDPRGELSGSFTVAPLPADQVPGEW